MATRQSTEILTLSAIRKPKDTKVTEYLFNEKQRIFTFPEEIKAAEETIGTLRNALKAGMPVKARLDSRRGLIKQVSVPSQKELVAFDRSRMLVKKPQKPRKVNVAAIDPTKYNIVDYYLKNPVFKLCLKTIPSYSKAKQIFDYCAQQSCHLPGPYNITPCIPFQYVIDGCYARAHKMRWIITNKYKYCCEKVFSFANQNDDRLAVKADKWGGCCVTWWYHVAPLVRVRVSLPAISKKELVLAMVIDPSMFDKPVLLSSWLSAQEKTACNANAKVSMYSIQAGSAYTPANYAGTAYTEDPSYTSTNATLTAYAGLTTC